MSIPALTFTYRNYRGEVSERRVCPISVEFGSNQWHPEPQWLLRAFDLDKGEDRVFAMRDMEISRAARTAINFALEEEEDHWNRVEFLDAWRKNDTETLADWENWAPYRDA